MFSRTAGSAATSSGWRCYAVAVWLRSRSGNSATTPQPCCGASSCALTVCGLHHGVLAATSDQRPGRLALLAWVERTFRPLPIDERVAPAYSRLAITARPARRDVRRGTADLLIAATAETHGL